MANYFQNIVNNFGAWLAGQIAPHINDRLGAGYNVLSHYYSGDHRPQLKRKEGAADDNITQNFIGLAVDRSVSRLFRGGVQFNLPEGADAQQEYIDRVWDLNKKEILLYQVGLHGAVYGTPYMKIVPDGILDPYTDELYPRLIALDPEITRLKTNPMDMAEIESYVIEYMFIRDDKEVRYREVTRHSKVEDYKFDEGEEATERDTWIVEEFEQVGGGQWQLVRREEFPYNFPPILHFKNLPSLKSPYGDSDIDDAINLQDKSNFIASNTGKIIKFHAHPEVIGTGFSAANMESVDSAVGTFRAITNENAKVFTLEMESDLGSSLKFGEGLRQSIFDISREVDISSMKDNVGALTNFGLHVLYTDALDKNDTKRQLYGDAIKELNRRLLVMNGWEKLESDPGKITWGSPIVENVMEELQADGIALDKGIIDLETVTKRYQNRYGVDYETVQANLANQKQKKAETDNIGADILRRRFNQGQ